MTGPEPINVVAGGVRIALRVIPRAQKTRLDGLRDGRLVLRVAAPPVDGAANDAVVEAIAERLHVPRRAVTIVAGDTARNKTIVVMGMDVARARAALVAPA